MNDVNSLNRLTTEQNNQNTRDIDSLSTLDMVRLINREDAKVIKAVELEAENIAKAIDIIAASLTEGGRLLYFGAGTSGRLGVLDASECPPTFGTDPDMVQGFIAGGDTALRNPVEGAEDDFDAGAEIVISLKASKNDVVVGIAASGRTKYVLGALTAARESGCRTIGLCNNAGTALVPLCDITIAPVCDAEVIQGSTRLKSGTAQKMVLNMLTTGSMIKLGKVYKNYMVDMRPSNEKLLERAKRLVIEITGCDEQTAVNALADCNNHVKAAVSSLLSAT